MKRKIWLLWTMFIWHWRKDNHMLSCHLRLYYCYDLKQSCLTFYKERLLILPRIHRDEQNNLWMVNTGLIKLSQQISIVTGYDHLMRQTCRFWKKEPIMIWSVDIIYTNSLGNKMQNTFQQVTMSGFKIQKWERKLLFTQHTDCGDRHSPQNVTMDARKWMCSGRSNVP